MPIWVAEECADNRGDMGIALGLMPAQTVENTGN
jgi:hypothetical protein